MLQVGLAERIALCFVLFLEREFHCIIKLSSGSLCSLDCPPNSPHPASALQVLGLQNATIPSLHQGEREGFGTSQARTLTESNAEPPIPTQTARQPHLCSLCSTIRQLWQVSTSHVSQKSLSTSCVCRGQYKAKSPEPPLTPVRGDRRCELLFVNTFL